MSDDGFAAKMMESFRHLNMIDLLAARTTRPVQERALAKSDLGSPHLR